MLRLLRCTRPGMLAQLVQPVQLSSEAKACASCINPLRAVVSLRTSLSGHIDKCKLARTCSRSLCSAQQVMDMLCGGQLAG